MSIEYCAYKRGKQLTQQFKGVSEINNFKKFFFGSSYQWTLIFERSKNQKNPTKVESF